MFLHVKIACYLQSRPQRYKISKILFKARMVESSFVQAHVLKMIEWIERLAMLAVERSVEMSTNLLLQSLLDFFSQFIVNFDMNKI